MTDLKKGDWVTISGKGPYKVESTDMRDASSLVRLGHGPRVYIGGTVRLWVDPDWCEKVMPPFRPEPGTYWLDSSYGPGVWRAIHDGQMRLVNTDGQVYEAEYVQKMYGPMTQLVPKEQADHRKEDQSD